ncbi:hypothetical protein [Rhodovastum atsumiense]|uniref:Calcium-binding protein n=1 Tax=Rhodovastum atsumiense TaxID=504468 RepID=A0A5M6IJA3_9PROT|nr:hypothetical protein [Rhodovastum atsumiense]KAA5607967.1 hypothetical protein F1189_31320 [Rhodovastum atsumiense]
MIYNDTRYADPYFGMPISSWTSPGDHAEFSIYQTNTGYVFHLQDNGAPDANIEGTGPGGASTYLSNEWSGDIVDFGRQVTYSLRARICEASGGYGFVGAGFEIQYNNPTLGGYVDGEKSVLVYMGVQLTGGYSESKPLNYFSYNTSESSITAIDQCTLGGDDYLPRQTDYGDLHTLTYNLNAYVAKVVCDFQAAGLATDGMKDLSNWKLTGMYLGPEVFDSNCRLGIDVADINVERDSNATFTMNDYIKNLATYSSGPVAVGITSYPISYAVTNITTNEAGIKLGKTYDGPVNYLKSEYGDNSGHNLAIGAQQADCWIYTGDGDDAIVALSGDNVIDAGRGSNWLVGGSGNDVFFETASPGQATWNTIVNFHPGDMVTIWDFHTGGSMDWHDGMGARDYEGLTLVALNSNGIGCSVTLAGLTNVDLKHIKYTTGNTGGHDYIQIINC